MPDESVDMVIIGGGITGAGVFHLAVASGFRALLLEANDFAWGTSSRSSKMVHGGLRYLKQGRLLLTRKAVKERQHLLQRYPGLVTPLSYLMPVYTDYGPKETTLKLGLSIYSLMAGKKQHHRLTAQQARVAIPALRPDHLKSALTFTDAQVDDARLVLRLITDAGQMGGTARNYIRAVGIERDRKGRVAAVNTTDTLSGRTGRIATRIVINATGANAEQFQCSPDPDCHIRPLRGSHLIFPAHLMPLDRVLSFFHPQDRRPVFAFPWQGAMILGTTDVDHDGPLDTEPKITSKEADYLMAGFHHVLPDCPVGLQDCMAAFAGIRPVLSKKNQPASKESREHAVWHDNGLVTVTGGKLTTFRLLARDTLKAVRSQLPAAAGLSHPVSGPELDLPQLFTLPQKIARRLYGRYGNAAAQLLADSTPDTLTPVPGTDTLWTELIYAAGHEQVRTLADLLLRRTRLGLVLPEGGRDQLSAIQRHCWTALPWDNARWATEIQGYLSLWQSAHAPPASVDKEP